MSTEKNSTKLRLGIALLLAGILVLLQLALVAPSALAVGGKGGAGQPVDGKTDQSSQRQSTNTDAGSVPFPVSASPAPSDSSPVSAAPHSGLDPEERAKLEEELREFEKKEPALMDELDRGAKESGQSLSEWRAQEKKARTVQERKERQALARQHEQDRQDARMAATARYMEMQAEPNGLQLLKEEVATLLQERADATAAYITLVENHLGEVSAEEVVEAEKEEQRRAAEQHAQFFKEQEEEDGTYLEQLLTDPVENEELIEAELERIQLLDELDQSNAEYELSLRPWREQQLLEKQEMRRQVVQQMVALLELIDQYDDLLLIADETCRYSQAEKEGKESIEREVVSAGQRQVDSLKEAGQRWTAMLEQGGAQALDSVDTELKRASDYLRRTVAAGEKTLRHATDRNITTIDRVEHRLAQEEARQVSASESLIENRASSAIASIQQATNSEVHRIEAIKEARRQEALRTAAAALRSSLKKELKRRGYAPPKKAAVGAPNRWPLESGRVVPTNDIVDLFTLPIGGVGGVGKALFTKAGPKLVKDGARLAQDGARWAGGAAKDAVGTAGKGFNAVKRFVIGKPSPKVSTQYPSSLMSYWDPKIGSEFSNRDWWSTRIHESVNNPARTFPTRDTRHWDNGLGRNNDPATVYLHKEGGYVIRNDRTGDVVQISNRNKKNWKSPWPSNH